MDKRYKHLDGEERGVILAEHRGEPAGDRLVVGPRAEHDRAGTGAGAAGRCADLPQLARSVQDARRLLCRRRTKLVQGSRLHD